MALILIIVTYSTIKLRNDWPAPMDTLVEILQIKVLSRSPNRR